MGSDWLLLLVVNDERQTSEGGYMLLDVPVHYVNVVVYTYVFRR